MREFEGIAAEGGPTPEGRRERRAWGVRDILKAVGLVVVLTVVASVPVGLVAAWMAGDAEIEDDAGALTVLLLASVLLEILMALAAVRFSVRKYRVPWGDLGLRRPRRGGFWFAGVLLFGGLGLMVVYLRALDAAGVDVSSDVPEKAFNNLAPAVVIGVIALLCAPVAEEVFFRGFVFGGLRGRWGTMWAALASGLLFGLAHAGNTGNLDGLLVVPPIAAVGVLFAFGYAYTGSLAASMVAHFLFNALQFSIGLATT